jgi:hypothetical protein
LPDARSLRRYWGRARGRKLRFLFCFGASIKARGIKKSMPPNKLFAWKLMMRDSAKTVQCLCCLCMDFRSAREFFHRLMRSNAIRKFAFHILRRRFTAALDFCRSVIVVSVGLWISN